MEFFKSTKVYNFMGKKKIFLALSIVIIFLSWSLVLTKGLNYGIDFAGGTIVQVKYDKKIDLSKIRDILKKSDKFSGSGINYFGSEEEIIIKIKTSSSSVANDVGDEIRTLLSKSSNDKFEIRRVDMVGPKVGGELRGKGIMSMLVSIIAILIYLAFRFEFRFAIASVLALIHDISITLGALALFEIEVNLDILAALLTILGYSLNDTIIVFDRIRESMQTTKERVLSVLINTSVSKTLSRTTLTSLTTFFVVLTLYLFGGEIIKGFSFTLLVGVVVGTYSSIFIAASTLESMGFSLQGYRQKESDKAKIRAEREKMRQMYEGGTV